MPLYYAVVNPMYQPAMRNILSITQATQALVTTTFDGTNPGAHDYISGLVCRIVIPRYFGMQQINQLKGLITVTSATQFTIEIDTTAFDPFFIPPALPGKLYTPAQVVPIGEKSDMLIGATRNVLPYP